MSRQDKPRRISPDTIPESLLKKYYKSGPRYTSYPTAPQFKAEFDQEQLKAEWLKTNTPKGKGLSLYLHIPFCEKRCLYCGCTTEAGHSQETAKEYLNELSKEVARIKKIIDASRPVDQLALGGGTPTFLKPELMTRLLNSLKADFHFPTAGERSIEIDPRTVDDAYLDLLSELGFNRFSFGVQDLDPQVQKNVGRLQSEKKIASLLSHLRQLGHDAINLDLIYGLPGQTTQSFGRTIDRVVKLKPSRIALFGFAFVPWVCPHQKALEKFHIPDPKERMALFGLAYNRLLDSGYEHIGLDHFALPQDELILALKSRTLARNFMGYTTRRGLDLVGIGASSISSVGATYAQNEKEVMKYIGKAGESEWVRALILSKEDLLRRELILDLFCNFFLDTAGLERKFQINFKKHFAAEIAALREMEQDNLIQLSEANLKVTALGRFFIRNICMVFDQYLSGEDSKSKYSKTL